MADLNQQQDNKKFTLSATDTVTLYFKDSGTDISTAKYFGIGQAAEAVSIIVNNVASLTHINGDELTAPITLGTDAANSFKERTKWDNITVRADSNNTTFEVFGN